MISYNTVKLMLKEVSPRVTNDAIEYLQKFLNENTMQVIQEANKVRSYVGRKTLIKEDLEFVFKKMFIFSATSSTVISFIFSVGDCK